MLRKRLIAVLNLLADEQQAHAVAYAIAQAAHAERKLVSDYIVDTLQVPDPPEPQKLRGTRDVGGAWLWFMVVFKTEKAVLVETPDSEIWLPLSQIRLRTGARLVNNREAELWVPGWLLRKNGLMEMTEFEEVKTA